MRFSFSLRCAFIVLSVFAVCVAIYGYKIRRQECIRALASRGVQLLWDHSEEAENLEFATVDDVLVNTHQYPWIDTLIGRELVYDVVGVLATGSSVDDDCFDALLRQGWRNVKRVDIIDTRISSRTLCDIARWREIESLTIKGTPVTRGDLEWLPRLEHLKVLRIESDDLDRTWVEGLKSVGSLRVIVLFGTDAQRKSELRCAIEEWLPQVVMVGTD